MSARTAAAWLGLGVWAAAVIGVGGALMAGHAAASDAPRLAGAAWAARWPDASRLVLLPGECSCVGAVIDALAARPADDGLWVVFAGEAPPRAAALTAGGHRVTTADPAALAALGVDAAPLLVVRDGTTIRWAGGLFDTPATVHPRVDRILAGLAAGAPEPPLPVFGCPVAPELAARADPLGLRRWR